MKGDGLVFAVAQRENDDEPTPEQLYTMGVIARIGQVQRGLGGVQLLLQGEHRATALHYHDGRGLPHGRRRCRSRRCSPLDENDPAFAALYRETRERAMELGETRGLPEEVLHQVLDSVTDPGRFADLVAGYLELPVAEKQALLETLGVEERLRRVLIHVQRQIGMLAAQAEIKSQVQEELGERQREMYLREQLKAIQKELGEDDQYREIDRAAREARASSTCPGRPAPRSSASSAGSSGPAASRWRPRSSAPTSNGSPNSPGTPDPTTTSTSNHAIEVLDEDHYGLQDVKDRVLEFLAVRQLRARQLAEEVEKTGEVPAADAQGREGHRHAVAGRRGRRGPADHRRQRGQGARHGQGPDPPVRRPAGRRQDLDRQVDRPVPWAGSTSAPRSAASATRPTSAATAGPTSAPCPAGSSRG